MMVLCPQLRNALVVLAAGLIWCSSQCQIASADSLVLRNGAKVSGKVKIKRDEKGTIEEYIVATDTGGYLKIAPSKVRRHIKPSTARKTYESLLAVMPDTAEAHWKMAEFCRKSHLNSERRFHIERTLQLDPNHAEARKAEGYRWHDGQWTRQSDVMERRGYVLYRGKYLLPQQVEELEREAEQKKKQGLIRRSLFKWRKWLGGPKHQLALEEFANITDPFAKGPLLELLRKEESPQNREVILKTLARFDGADVVEQLVYTALHDEDDRVLELAVDLLVQRPEKAYAANLLLPYLASSDNWKVNQAASILGKLDARDTILPLIGSLITVHTKKIYPAGNIRPTFSNGPNGGGTGLSTGVRPKVISREIKNPHVLGALVKMTGKNFQYSEQAWRDWYKQQRAPAVTNLRRDL